MERERILSKFDQIDGYLDELDSIKPENLREYKNSIEKKRACERLLQISIESIIDICNIISSKFRLGLPFNEEDMIKKMLDKKIISNDLFNILDDMKGFRNILVHRYGKVEDEKVFEILADKLDDFEKFKKEILIFLKKNNK